MRLVLFDIDGTLILTGGAGMRAFYRAFRSVFEIAVEGEPINPDGKTDPLIARECLEFFRCGHRWCDEARDALFESYLDCLEEEMERAKNSARLNVLPGVSALLGVLAAEPEFALGLVTGNLERGARIKLGKAGLDHHFRFGGYGSDSEDRTALIRVAIERGCRHVAPRQVEDCFVIGDTPLDISHGHAAGCRVIAVASSRYTMEDLRVHSPDLLVPDLTGIESIVAFLRS